jgi:hypothetical protein
MKFFRNSEGCQFGTAATMIVSGYLIHGGVGGGWPSVFYVSGGLSIVWFILWAIFLFDKPSDHPRITAEERNYIERSIGGSGGADSQSNDKNMSVPWKDIFLSLPFWAILIGQTGHCWGTLSFEIVNYHHVLCTILQKIVFSFFQAFTLY